MDAAGATPSLMITRRSGPMRFIRKSPNPRAPCTRQKIRKQTAVEQIDRQGATGDVRAAHMLISSRHSPDVATGAMGGRDEFAYGRGVAQTEIEALRPDRGNYVRRFPDQHHAPGSQTCRGLDPQLKDDRDRARR